VQFIVTPLHVTQSQYDSYQLPAILALGCDPPKNQGKNCSSQQLQSFQQYRVDMMAALRASGLYTVRAGYGMFNDACIAHTQGYYGDYYDNPEWEVPAQSGTTLAHSLNRWLADSIGGRNNDNNIHVDQVAWPNNQPCAKDGVDSGLTSLPRVLSRLY
jgi:hypothetical protein